MDFRERDVANAVKFGMVEVSEAQYSNFLEEYDGKYESEFEGMQEPILDFCVDKELDGNKVICMSRAYDRAGIGEADYWIKNNV